MIKLRYGVLIAAIILILCPIAYAAILGTNFNNHIQQIYHHNNAIQVESSNSVEVRIPNQQRIAYYNVNYEGIGSLVRHSHYTIAASSATV